jgi:hypothetical protein
MLAISYKPLVVELASVFKAAHEGLVPSEVKNLPAFPV